MPKYRGGVHQAGRKRRPRIRRVEGAWEHFGPQQIDAQSGWLFPVKLMREQEGGLVSVKPRDGSFDYPPEY